MCGQVECAHALGPAFFAKVPTDWPTSWPSHQHSQSLMSTYLIDYKGVLEGESLSWVGATDPATFAQDVRLARIQDEQTDD